MDQWLRPDASAMVTGVEGKRGEDVREVFMQQPGEVWDEDHYERMNLRYQEQALEHLRILASKEAPFFLNYWPCIPSQAHGCTRTSDTPRPTVGITWKR